MALTSWRLQQISWDFWGWSLNVDFPGKFQWLIPAVLYFELFQTKKMKKTTRVKASHLYDLSKKKTNVTFADTDPLPSITCEGVGCNYKETNSKHCDF